jgi:hypothetical protein
MNKHTLKIMGRQLDFVITFGTSGILIRVNDLVVLRTYSLLEAFFIFLTKAILTRE